ncbi:unnamed protein product [Malus baccata var. baccata]
MAHNLPEETIHDILHRLPPKSLIICTSVCKPWNSMIKNPSFIRTHLTRTIDLNNQFGTHLLLVCCARIVKRSRFRHGNTVMLCNPSTRKSVTLPKPRYTFKGVRVTTDYKVVRITFEQWPNPSAFYEVYSLAGGSWSDPCSLDHVNGLKRTCKPVFVNGAIHWKAYHRLTNGVSEYFILAFDVGSDSFRRIMTPENFRSSSGEDFYISGYGKSIALSKRYYTNIREPCLDIWLMKECGMEESWTKLTTLCPPGPETGVCYRPLCIRKSGDLVLVPADGYTDITMPNLMLRASSYLTRPMQFLTEEKNRFQLTDLIACNTLAWRYHVVVNIVHSSSMQVENGADNLHYDAFSVAA